MHISVVIPAFNEEKFLPKILQSLQKQTMKPYEIIVVDNNSTDNTAAVAKKFGAKVIKAQQKGYAHACNTGFNKATGEIIARADADYIVPSHWIASINNSFKKNKKLIAIGGPVYPYEGYWWEHIFTFPAVIFYMFLLRLLGKGFLFPNIAMKKSAFKKIGGFNTTINFGEDVEMCLRLKKLGKVALAMHMYVYASMRRLYNMGLKDFVFHYCIENQLAIWKGEKVTVGINPVRSRPYRPAAPASPLRYLLIVPLTVMFMLIATICFSYNPIRQYALAQIIQPTIRPLGILGK